MDPLIFSQHLYRRMHYIHNHAPRANEYNILIARGLAEWTKHQRWVVVTSGRSTYTPKKVKLLCLSSRFK
jgi:hypothetical protein